MNIVEEILNRTLASKEEKEVTPPPEEEKPKYRKYVDKFSHVTSKVDTSPPLFDMTARCYMFDHWRTTQDKLFMANTELVHLLRKQSLARGKVDSHWEKEPFSFGEVYLQKRISFLKRIEKENKMIYKRILSAQPKVETTKSQLRSYKSWVDHVRRWCEGDDMLLQKGKDIDWPAPPQGVSRPRAWILLGFENGCALGSIQVELFTDVVPQTCQLFSSLLAGDGVGFGYVGTCFFRKVPGLFWSGGDVIYDNGFGCYAERGKVAPIQAENFHFRHTAPGLLSMRLTACCETCCEFNITFKPLPQFDCCNVVFGRVIQPCNTFEAMKRIGAALSPWPKVVITGSRIKKDGHWIEGVKNTRIEPVIPKRVPKPKH